MNQAKTSIIPFNMDGQNSDLPSTDLSLSLSEQISKLSLTLSHTVQQPPFLFLPQTGAQEKEKEGKKKSKEEEMGAPKAFFHHHHHHWLPLFFLLLHAVNGFSSSSHSPGPDLRSLVSFKATADPSGKGLPSWNLENHPCNWTGVTCNARGDRVFRLVLEEMNLTGSILPLASLSRLRVLSLKGNALAGPIPDLSNLTSLKLLFLSHNRFSGPLPSSLSLPIRLFRLDLSFNRLSGNVPPSLSALSHLLTLRLEDNLLSGTISSLNITNLRDLNVSGNHLGGPIPQSLSSFPPSAFSLNPDLCGAPLPRCKAIVSDPCENEWISSGSFFRKYLKRWRIKTVTLYIKLLFYSFVIIL